MRKIAAVLAVAGVALYAVTANHGVPVASTSTHASSGAGATGAAATAIAYTRQQIGKPYLWGGTGPGAFDCSGLVMRAYASAGISIARTSQDQWATEPHVTTPQPGDLVFYAGSDGTMTAPGHVAIVTGPGRMIEAYATGYPIRETPIRPGVVGYTDPAAPGAA